MAAGVYNIAIEQGATYDQTFTWTVNGSPVNLGGYAARMQIRPTVESSVVSVDVSDDGTITLGGAAGTVRVQLDATATAGMTAGSYVYDLELENSGVVTRLLKGAVSVDAEVTR